MRAQALSVLLTFGLVLHLAGFFDGPSTAPFVVLRTVPRGRTSSATLRPSNRPTALTQGHPPGPRAPAYPSPSRRLSKARLSPSSPSSSLSRWAWLPPLAFLLLASSILRAALPDRRSVAAAAASGAATGDASNADAATLKDLMERLSLALQSPSPPPAGTLIRARARATLMGMMGTATLTFDPSGASVHRAVDCTGTSGDPIAYATAVAMSLPPPGRLPRRPPPHPEDLPNGSSALNAHDPAAACWERDWSGLASELELEDAEALALGHWLGTGQWLHLVAAGVLQVTAMDDPTLKRTAQLAAAAQPDFPIAAATTGTGPTGLAVRIAGGRIVASVLLDPASCTPMAATMGVAGGTEVWRWEDWAPRGEAAVLPRRAVFLAPGCDPTIYELLDDPPEALPSDDRAPWLLPPSPLTGSLLDSPVYFTLRRSPDQLVPDPSLRPEWRPPDAPSPATTAIGAPGSASPLGVWYEGHGSGPEAEVPVWVGEGGHLLCQPSLAGRTLGLFIIDTGTSCLVLDPDALPADLAARAERFAFHTVQGLGGAPLQSALCRGLGPLTLGPLMLERPLFREASLAGAVRGPPGMRPSPPIVGILGYDFLRHCRLEIGIPGPQSPGVKLWMRIRRSGGLASPRVAVGWQCLRFLGRVPHLRVRLGTAVTAPLRPPTVPQEVEGAEAIPRSREASPLATTESHEGLFRLALGVGGVGLIVAARLATRLCPPDDAFALRPGGIVSGPASREQPVARLQSLSDAVRTVRLAEVTFPGASFELVRALCYLRGDPDDLELSVYADGVAGAPLFQGCCLVLDYANRRASVAQLRDENP